ncbi:hypothetical protein RB195_013621 [Necator americanus]|uniref:Uncharacterized protein n=1 Tax=Necator americanus TaxID=51031 RepID=A0ABR1DWG3_NECAM
MMISINNDNLLPTSHKITDSFGVEFRRLGGEESPKVIFEVVTIIVALLFRVILKRSEENVVELRVLLADLVGLSLQLSAADLGSNCRVVRQQLETVYSMNSPPDAQHDLLLMDFTFHERIRHFIASAPRTFVGGVDVEDPFFISNDNGVQPVESAASEEQLNADVFGGCRRSMNLGVTDRAFSPFREISVHCSRWTTNSQDSQ